MKARTGVPGKSAYQSWLEQGNSGSEVDFLASLKGPQGPAGEGNRELPRVPGLLIPLYIYPSNIFTNADYNALIDLARAHPKVPVTVILNPSSGPGSVVDGNYSAAIRRLHGAQITVLGYVSTDYTNRDIAQVKADTDSWLSLYPAIDGLFLDEMDNQDAQATLNYYGDLRDYGHAAGLFPVVANPGAGVPNALFDTVDQIVVWESNGFPSEATLKGDYDGGYADISPRRRAAVVWGNAFDRAQFELMAKYAGAVLITDSATPWSELPSALSEMLAALDGAPAFNPSHYTPTASTLEGHLSGIDDALALAGTGGVADMVANKTVSADAVNGVLPLDLSEGRNVYSIYCDGDVELELVNAAGKEQQLILFLIGDGTQRSVSLKRIRYDKGSFTITAGVRRVAIDLNDALIVPQLDVTEESTYVLDPPGLSATPGDNQVSVDWTSPSTRLRFFIQVDAGGYVETTNNPVVFTAPTVNNGTESEFSAYLQDNWGNQSAIVSASATPTAPSANPSADLVVADPTALHQSESELRAWLESLGYVVTLIDDGAAPPATPANLTIYSPIADNGPAAMNRYRAYPGPLIMMANVRPHESGLSKDFGAIQPAANTDWAIINTSHPITQGLSTTQTVWSTAKRCFVLHQAHDLSGAVPLVDIGNGAGLRAIEAFPVGISLNGGYTSTHRAVAFAANNSSSGSDRGTIFWTAAYKTLLERSIQWVRGLI